MTNYAELDALDVPTWVLDDGHVEYANRIAGTLLPQIQQLDATQIQRLCSRMQDTWALFDVLGDTSTFDSAHEGRLASFGQHGKSLLQARPASSGSAPELQLIDALAQRIVCLDADNNVVWANQTTADKFSLSRQEMVGMSLFAFLPNDVAAAITRSIQNVRASGETALCYLEGSLAQGIDDNELISQIKPLGPDSNGRVIIVCNDVSLQKPLRGQVAAKTAILERIARAEPVAIVLNELVQHVKLYSNATCASIMLVRPSHKSDTRGSFSVVASSALPPFVQDALEGQPVALESGPCGSSAIYGRRELVDDIPSIHALRPLADELRSASINACWSEPISSPSGKVVGSLVIYFDSVIEEDQHRELIAGAALAAGIAIEREETERRLITVNAELEQRVVDRTHALTRSLQDTQRARVEAENAAQAKSRFLAAASHDLRQPLQAMTLYLSVLQNNPPAAQLDEITEKIGNAVSAMSDTLASLLDITSISSGKIKTHIKPFCISGVLARLKAVHEPRAEAAGLTMLVECAECEIISDEALFYRIIDNLLTNAISYTEQGSVRLRCTAVESQIRIEITDTGVGIEPSQHQRIFEEYVQLRNPGRTRKMGIGLGLAVVAQLCKLLNHDVQLTSEPGIGSTFSICATRAPHNTAASAPAPVAQNAITAEYDRTRPCVLFVDDDEDIVDAMSLVMQGHDFTLLTCNQAGDALSVIARGIEPDLLITDLRLPDLSGHELIHKARRITGTTLPAILITGYAGSLESVDQPEEVDLLKKPVNTDVLLKLVEQKIYGVSVA
jgi:signal transduction histidine kinase/ActR/RegA family two-component response regulator/PAS domain-containing protein